MVMMQIRRYENGLQKLQHTEVTVHEMQEKLEQLQPILEKKTKENQQMLSNLFVRLDFIFDKR
jgi:hypothetical protein